MVKMVVDAKRGILGAGGELHADAEKMLLADGSHPEDVWGVNFYPWHPPEDRISYTALINIRPRLGHATMEIHDETLCTRIRHIIESLVLSPDENLV